MQTEMQREITESPVSFDKVMATAGRWIVAADALAALGAELRLLQMGTETSPDVRAALTAVSAAAGLEDLNALPGPQRDAAIGLIRMTLHHAIELVEDPSRSPGWTYTDPAILQGWGRGSMVVPGALKAAPELTNVQSFLDIGTGVGLLAVAAARVWPDAKIVGIDIWPPSLKLAETSVRAAWLQDHITIRTQDVAAWRTLNSTTACGSLRSSSTERNSRPRCHARFAR